MGDHSPVTLQHRPIFPALAVAGLVFGQALLPAGAAAVEWPGFHGLLRQGASPSAQCATSWSTNANVRWSVVLPGEGHASPVVGPDAVYLSTAYRSRACELLKLTVRYVGLTGTVLCGLLVLYLALRHGAARTRAPVFVRWLVLLLLAGLLVRFVFSAHSMFGLEISGHGDRFVRWLFSVVLVCLCLILAPFGLRRSSWARVGAGLALVVFSWLVYAGRPNPKYYGLREGASHTRRVLAVVVGLPAGVGAVALAGAVFAILLARLRRRRDGSAGSGSGRALRSVVGCSRRGLAVRAVALLLGFGLGLTAFGVPWLVRTRYPVRAAVRDWLRCGRGAGLTFFGTFLCVFLLGALLWLISDVLFGRRRSLRVSVFARCAWCLVVLVVFLDLNYLSVRQQYLRAIVCVDRRSGAIRWTAEGLRHPQPPVHQDNSPASPTPVFDGTRVTAYFGTAGALCVDRDGDVLWTNRALPFEGIHGVGASPVLAGGSIIVVSDMAAAPYITALDPTTGERVWTVERTPWKGSHGCHSTPAVGVWNGQELIVVRGLWDLTAYAAESGAVLWRTAVPGKFEGERIVAPLLDGDRLYVFHRNQVSALSISNIVAGTAPVAWTVDMRGRGPNISTPALRAGMLFMVSDDGVATCLDAESGEQLWRTRLRGRHYASVVATKDAVYFCDKRGRTSVLACARELRELAENHLREPVFASPAIAGNELFIRSTERLWCLGPARDAAKNTKARLAAGRSFARE